METLQRDFKRKIRTFRVRVLRDKSRAVYAKASKWDSVNSLVGSQRGWWCFRRVWEDW